MENSLGYQNDQWSKKRGDSMKIGILCKVTSRTSHYPPQFGHLIVVTGKLNRTTNTGASTVVVGRNLNTGREHHYFTNEIEEVKQ